MDVKLEFAKVRKLANASKLPQVYYGLHMTQGVAEYNDPGFKGRVLVLDDTIRQMNPTAAGRPMFVRHVDGVDLETIQEDADGFVVESFYNPPDGNHWIKFLIVSDAGHEAIAKKYALSNAYLIKGSAPGGVHQGVQFDKEVTSGEFEHFALVDNPRYEQSIILTPEEFKAHNEALLLEIQKLANSKETPVLNLFRKPKVEKVENSAEIENLSVKLKSGTEKTLIQLVNEAEAHEEMEKKKAENGAMAEGEGYVMLGEKKMTVNEMVEAHKKLQESYNALSAEHEKLKSAAPAAPAAAVEKKEEPATPAAKEEPAMNEGDKGGKEGKEGDSAEDKAMNAHFDALKNAPDAAAARAAAASSKNDSVQYESLSARVDRGKSRYGS